MLVKGQSRDRDVKREKKVMIGRWREMNRHRERKVSSLIERERVAELALFSDARASTGTQIELSTSKSREKINEKASI